MFNESDVFRSEREYVNGRGPENRKSFINRGGIFDMRISQLEYCNGSPLEKDGSDDQVKDNHSIGYQLINGHGGPMGTKRAMGYMGGGTGRMDKPRGNGYGSGVNNIVQYSNLNDLWRQTAPEPFQARDYTKEKDYGNPENNWLGTKRKRIGSQVLLRSKGNTRFYNNIANNKSSGERANGLSHPSKYSSYSYIKGIDAGLSGRGRRVEERRSFSLAQFKKSIYSLDLSKMTVGQLVNILIRFDIQEKVMRKISSESHGPGMKEELVMCIRRFISECGDDGEEYVEGPQDLGNVDSLLDGGMDANGDGESGRLSSGIAETPKNHIKTMYYDFYNELHENVYF